MRNNHCTPDPDVVATKLDEEEMVLLHLKTKEYFSLNATGLRIWEGLQQQNSPTRVAEALTEEYDIGQEEALTCVGRFIEGLRREGLMVKADG